MTAKKLTSNNARFILKDQTSGKSWKLEQPISEQKNVPQASTFTLIQQDNERDCLVVLDNRTQQLYKIPITNNTINAKDFQQISSLQGSGLRIYDPAYLNTAVARSSICFIDGDAGILTYRGYPIEELAEHSNFLEVTYLLIFGELPTQAQFDYFSYEVLHHTFLHENVSTLMRNFNYDAHPMGMFISAIAAMSTFHPEANPALQGSDLYLKNPVIRNKQIFRLLGKVPTVAAQAYRHRIGRPYNRPKDGLDYAENFLYMLDRLSEESYRPNPVLSKALDVLFILHAEHELNCSTAAARHIGSTLADPYSMVAGASAALYGPLHGGANEAVLRMLEQIKTVEAVPEFLEQVKQRKRKLMGFGHRVYRNYDPRAKLIRRIAYQVFEVCGRESLIDIALELEKAALADPYFVERKLYPNVDFYSGLIYKAMGFPTDFFPVLFAIPRTAGWLAHWVEACQDAEQKIWRPRQVYVGPPVRTYVNRAFRTAVTTQDQELARGPERHAFSKRSHVADYLGKSNKAKL